MLDQFATLFFLFIIFTVALALLATRFRIIRPLLRLYIKVISTVLVALATALWKPLRRQGSAHYTGQPSLDE